MMNDTTKWLNEQRGRTELEVRFLMSLKRQTKVQTKYGRGFAIELEPAGPEEISPTIPKSHSEHFSKPDRLQEYLKLAIKSPGRRLIILEDLGLEWIAALNENLGVPISVFAQHWASPLDHTQGKVRIPLGQNVNYGFVLNYVESHPIRIPGKNKDLTYRIACNSYRTITFKVKDDDKSQTSEQLVSFWGTDRVPADLNSWTSLLLVDPPLNKDLRHSIFIEEQQQLSPNSEPLPINCFRLDDSYSELPPLSQNKELDLPPKHQLTLDRPENDLSLGRSMFDDLVSGGNGIPSSVPSSATYRCRRLVLARTAAVLQTTFADAINLSLSSTLGVDQMATFDFDTFERTAWNSQWEGTKFTKLWEQREDLELLRYKLRQNIQTLKRVAEASQHHVEQQVNPLHKEIQHQEENDLLEWTDLEATAEYINQVIVRTTASYLQTVAAREAQVSNFQARSVGQLTRMATVFVPVSLCAAIFSMNNAFSAGNHLFWIFWAVSLPIAAALVILMFTPLGMFLSRMLAAVRSWSRAIWSQWRSRDLRTPREKLEAGWQTEEKENEVASLSSKAPKTIPRQRLDLSSAAPETWGPAPPPSQQQRLVAEMTVPSPIASDAESPIKPPKPIPSQATMRPPAPPLPPTTFPPINTSDPPPTPPSSVVNILETSTNVERSTSHSHVSRRYGIPSSRQFTPEIEEVVHEL